MVLSEEEYYEWLEKEIKLEKQITYYENWTKEAKEKIHNENRSDIINATYSRPIVQEKEIEFLIDKYKESKYDNSKDKVLIEKFYSLKKEFEDFYNKNKELYDKKLKEDIILCCEKYLRYTNPPEHIFDLEEEFADMFDCRNFLEINLIERPFLREEIEKYKEKLIRSDDFIKNNAKKILERGISVEREFYPKSYWWWHLEQFLSEEDKEELKKKGILWK